MQSSARTQSANNWNFHNRHQVPVDTRQSDDIKLQQSATKAKFKWMKTQGKNQKHTSGRHEETLEENTGWNHGGRRNKMDQEMRENKGYKHGHTNEGMRNRWSEERKAQVEEVKERKDTGRREKHTEEELKSKTICFKCTAKAVRSQMTCLP